MRALGEMMRVLLTAGGRRLAGVDVADDDDVDMSLFFAVVEESRVSKILLKLLWRLDSIKRLAE